MVELRWTKKTGRLQWRVHLPVTDISGNLCVGDWTEWETVPVVDVPDDEEST